MGDVLRARIGIFTGLLGVILLLLLAKVFFLQTVCHASFKARAERISSKIQSIPARRGGILDRNNELLAYDRPVFDLHCYIHRCPEPEHWNQHPLQVKLTELLPGLPPPQQRRIEKVLRHGWRMALQRCLLNGRGFGKRQLAACRELLKQQPEINHLLGLAPSEIAESPAHREQLLAFLLRGELAKKIFFRRPLSRVERECLPERWQQQIGIKGCPDGKVRKGILKFLFRARDRVLVKGIDQSKVLRYLRSTATRKRWESTLDLHIPVRYVRQYTLGRAGGQAIGGIFPGELAPVYIGLHKECLPGGVLATGNSGYRHYIRHGHPKWLKLMFGDPVEFMASGASQAPDACDRLRTTLDKSLQRKLAMILDAGGKEHAPEFAAAILMDACTGNILAMQSWPQFEPFPERLKNCAEPEKIAATRRNHCIESRFEPGSTMKSFIIAAALDDRLVTLTSLIDCAWNTPQGYKLPGCNRVIKDDHILAGVGNPAQTPLAQVLIQSSNIGACRIGTSFDRHRFVKWFHRFGLSSKLQLRLPRKMGPMFSDVDGLISSEPNREGEFLRWDGASISFGYSFSVNLTRLAASYASLINGGTRIEPRLIKSEGRGAGQGDRVLAPETSRIMRQLLGRVVTDEHGTGYRMAGEDRGQFGGKTGTTFRTRGGKRVYWASFVGFAPLDKPRYVAAAVYFKKNTRRFYGGKVAGPTVRDILISALAREKE